MSGWSYPTMTEYFTASLRSIKFHAFTLSRSTSILRRIPSVLMKPPKNYGPPT